MARSARLLVVDDEPEVCKSLAAGLRLEGFEVVEALHGEAALACLEQDVIDMVITDLMMPRMNGLDLIRHMKFKHPMTPIVLCSGYELSERQLSRIGGNILGFVTKPYSHEELAVFLRDKLDRIAC